MSWRVVGFGGSVGIVACGPFLPQVGHALDAGKSRLPLPLPVDGDVVLGWTGDVILRFHRVPTHSIIAIPGASAGITAIPSMSWPAPTFPAIRTGGDRVRSNKVPTARPARRTRFPRKKRGTVFLEENEELARGSEDQSRRPEHSFQQLFLRIAHIFPIILSASDALCPLSELYQFSEVSEKKLPCLRQLHVSP